MTQTADLGVLAVQFDADGEWQTGRTYPKNIVVPWNNAMWGSTRAMAAGEEPGVSSGWAYLCGGSNRPAYTETEVSFYISPSGGRQNNGLSADAPFSSFDDVLAWLDKHEFTDTNFVVNVYFMPGTYPAMAINGQCLKNCPSNFRFYAYDSADKPIIRQLSLLNAPTVSIENINFQPVRSEGSSYGIFAQKYSTVTLTSCNFTLQDGCVGIGAQYYSIAEMRGNTSISVQSGCTASRAIYCSWGGSCINGGTLMLKGAYTYAFDARFNAVMDLTSGSTGLVKLSISSKYAVTCGGNSLVSVTNISGTNSGGSYYVNNNSLIYVHGAGANYIPGSNPKVYSALGGIYA